MKSPQELLGLTSGEGLCISQREREVMNKGWFLYPYGSADTADIPQQPCTLGSSLCTITHNQRQFYLQMRWRKSSQGCIFWPLTVTDAWHSLETGYSCCQGMENTVQYCTGSPSSCYCSASTVTFLASQHQFSSKGTVLAYVPSTAWSQGSSREQARNKLLQEIKPM